ncbi:MAG: hypothetical protein IKO99_02325 [Bacteroidales bacterium]|nr:hypothetical protein [Bacteroidales bacterium]
MEIGWIDFSDTDRKKALNVIALLNDEGAVDEIGIGIVRDAFADRFFPGTSTIQTRAKYFFIVPYAIKKALQIKSLENYKLVLSEIENNIEKDCAKKLKKSTNEREGVIGARSLPKSWVSRKPSSIYWNGLKTFGIFTKLHLSLAEYIHLELENRKKFANQNTKSKNKTDNDASDFDDDDAGKERSATFWNLPEYDEQNWMKELKINLTKAEAGHLRKMISENLQGSLFKFLLDNNIKLKENAPFESVFEQIFDKLSPENQELVRLANLFNILVCLCRTRYNIILLGENSFGLKDKWDGYFQRVQELENLDIEHLFKTLKLPVTGTTVFLNNAKRLLLENDIQDLDYEIIKRERNLKGEKRAKLLNKNSYTEPVAQYELDYRLKTAIKILNDIYQGEEQENV